ncbi:MAG TPA: YaeQ family protein [Vicinamibacterales bacterium]
MALTATIYNFDIDLSDNDRGVYETVAIRAAQHPSESPEYLVARVLAYLLEFREGIEFSRGVSEPEEPMISIRDLTGKISTWIDIGTPDSTRLHKASKSAARVVVYCHKEYSQWLKGLAAANIHRADALELYAIDRTLIAELVARLDRRMAFGVSISDRELYVSIGDVNLTGRVERLTP